jgi:uncharacterized repeat protein (TIGR01451 family)
MKKLILNLFALLLLVSPQLKAQYVTIPDAKFAAWLQANIPSAMNGNQMDTTSTAVTSYTVIDVQNDSIGDLTGIQYFDSLQELYCNNNGGPKPNYLTSLPKLPSTLNTLACGENKITSLPALPNTLTALTCYNNPLHSLPVLPNKLNFLRCSSDSLTSLPTLLPDSLQYIDCSFNYITNLPTLTSLPLTDLSCTSNLLTSLPALPNTLINLNCDQNQITNLPVLPGSLQALYCDGNQLTTVPTLPNTLLYFYCNVNQLTALPNLPTSLSGLSCNNNQLTTLPALPISLKNISCSSNQLTSLPLLPDSLTTFDCSNNQITCFPVFPNTLVTLGNITISNNPFTCLPNYVAAMDATTLATPLCTSGNTNGCPYPQGIFGFTYNDMNANCMRNVGDTNLKNIPIQLYDNSNNLLGQTYSALNGVYNFPQANGTYTVVIDTINPLPFKAQCNNLGLDSTLTVATIDTNINFSLTCKSGFDIGVQSAINYGKVFPGQQHTLYTIAGDLSQWYNFNCAAGISGQVQITVTGPVTYVSPAPGALTPSVAGNVYTYTIADFSTANIATAFNVMLSTNTNANMGDTICVNINVTPTAGDNNQSNNNYSFCYQVTNSHDPNFKETYPVNVAPAYNNWFTYTIHFQNTGSAAAINIRLADTLDAKLDLSTFQLINYSHKNTVLLNHNILNFNFHNINLPDSTSNHAGSSGFVQYRIKPKTNLPAGTQIKNTAYIYFDYNAAIVTNTSVNNFGTPLDIKNNNIQSSIKIYPNPANNKIMIDANDVVDVKLFDVLGKQIFSTKENNIDVSNFNDGVYFIQVQTKQGTTTQKIIVQH